MFIEWHYNRYDRQDTKIGREFREHYRNTVKKHLQSIASASSSKQICAAILPSKEKWKTTVLASFTVLAV